MTTKKKDRDIFAEEWMNRIASGKSFRTKHSSYSKWDAYRKMYRNDWSSSVVPVNKVFSYGRMLIPKVYFRAPRISVTATRPDLIWHAKVVEAIDNILIKQSLLKGTLKQSVLDAFLCGIGPIKVGYDSLYGYLPEQAISDDGETGTQVSRKDGTKIEYQTGVYPGMPWALRVMPDDIIVPWGTRSASSIPWIAHNIIRPLEDVKADQKYNKALTAKLVGTRTSSKEGRRTAFKPFGGEHNKDELYADLWEVRDIKTGHIYVICEEQLILAEEDPLLRVGGIPYEFIIFNSDSEYFWPISDATILEPQQLELNNTSTQESRHRAIALLKFLYKENRIDRGELEKLLSGKVGVAVEIKESDEPLANAIQMLQPHVPPDLRMAMKGILQDMQESLGVGANQLGNFSPYHGKTAAESMIVNESNEARQDERRDIVADVLVNIVQKWNKMIFEFWNEEKVTRIVTPQGEPFWIKHTGPDLKGDYLLNVDPDSGMPLTRTLKYQMGQDMWKQFNGDELINQVLLREIVLDAYSTVDPRASMLLNVPQGVDAQASAKQRQPFPATSKSGGMVKGKTGPGGGEIPMELAAFAKTMGQGGSKQ